MNAADRRIVDALAAMLRVSIDTLNHAESLRCAAYVFHVAQRTLAGSGLSGLGPIAEALLNPVAQALRSELPPITQRQAIALAEPLSVELAQRLPPDALHGPPVPPPTAPTRQRWEDADEPVDTTPALSGKRSGWKQRKGEP